MKSLYTPPKPEDGILEHDLYFPARDGYQLRAHVYESSETTTSASRPLVVYLHGGGWTIGSPEDTTASCRNLVKKLGVVCIAPSYRLGPEDPFPAGINDTWDSLQWIAAHAEEEIGVSLAKGFIVGGSSAGGNMAAVISHLARDERLNPAISGLFLLAPLILPTQSKDALSDKYKDIYISRTQPECQTDPVLTPAMERMFHDAAQSDKRSPLHVPYIWPTGHKNLPKTYFQVCGMDILRDENLIYEQMLREEAGIQTKLDVYPGMPHVFWGIFPQLAQSKKASIDLVEGIKWLLDA